MAEIFNPLTLTSLTNQTSAITVINSNFATLATSLQDVLSRSGVSPNSMASSLDMNSNRLLNLPTPVALTEPLRVQDALTPPQITIVTAGSPASSLGVTLITSLTAATMRSILGVGAVLGKYELAPSFVTGQSIAAVGDGVTDDTSAITTAETFAFHKFIPSGNYKTTIASSALKGPYWGYGQIIDSTPNHRAPWFSQLLAAPSSTVGFASSIETAFNGDISHVQLPIEHRITGAATLSQPATGYVYTPEAYPHYTYLLNTSGWNQGTATNVGRTAAVAYFTRVDNTGQGDAVAYNGDVFVNGARAGATSYLANPAGTVVNGQVTAGQAGVYLNPAEYLLQDQGFDVAAAGSVLNLQRTVNTGALQAWWVGYRAQSTGSVATDVAFSASGSYVYGLDLSQATFGTNQAAITLATDQKIYGGVTADGSGLSRFPGGLGTQNYISFASSISGWLFVVGATSILQLSSSQVTATQGFRVSNTAGIGFTTGAGGAVTQATSKTTAVTLNTACGVITMNGAALASNGTVSFQLNNTLIGVNDILNVCIGTVGSVASYRLIVNVTGAGTAVITVTNVSGGSLSEAVTLNFALIKGSIT